jgi:hypothetical protein
MARPYTDEGKEIQFLFIYYEVIRHLGYLSNPWKRHGLPVGSMPTSRIWFGGLLGHLRVLGAAHISSRERYGTTGPNPIPYSSVGGGLLQEDIQALILIIPLWIIPPIYLDMNNPPIDGGSPSSTGLKIVDLRRISHSGKAEWNEASLLRSVEKLMVGGQKVTPEEHEFVIQALMSLSNTSDPAILIG